MFWRQMKKIYNSSQHASAQFPWNFVIYDLKKSIFLTSLCYSINNSISGVIHVNDWNMVGDTSDSIGFLSSGRKHWRSCICSPAEITFVRGFACQRSMLFETGRGGETLLRHQVPTTQVA
uniref:Uncharacterized protein n=1 Tax=Opuntia streptacantha TaxID=393608 RepID=A0A7C9DXC4_OPUST